MTALLFLDNPSGNGRAAQCSRHLPPGGDPVPTGPIQVQRQQQESVFRQLL